MSLLGAVPYFLSVSTLSARYLEIPGWNLKHGEEKLLQGFAVRENSLRKSSIIGCLVPFSHDK
jgi:hypothetical protein